MEPDPTFTPDPSPEPEPTLMPEPSSAPNSALMEQPPIAPPAPPAKKKIPRRTIFLFVALGLFVTALVCGLAGLGYYAYTLNEDLKTSEANYATLKGQFDALTVEKNKLTENLNATTAELEATKAELETNKTTLADTQAQLEEAKSEISGLLEKIDLARKYVNVMVGAWSDEDTFSETRIKIKAT
ncbi:MAG: hypothetical protein AB1750_11675, partial [Chloroflexota bacterium]